MVWSKRPICQSDARPQALIGEANDILDGLLQLPINGKHRDPMDVRPDVLRKLERWVRFHEAMLLQRYDGIDQPLKRRRAFLRELGIARAGGVDVAAEHHPIVRGMMDGELHVGGAHRVEPFPPASVCLPDFQQFKAQRAKPFSSHGGQQGRLVGKVTIQSCSRDAELLAHRPQRECLDPAALDRPDGLLKQRPGQIPVVIAIRSFSGHKPMVPPYVDIVNMNGYTMLTMATLTTMTLLERLWRTDRRLTAVGLAMFALLAATGVALLLDPREIGGAPAWMKPAKFAASIGVYTLTLAWVFSYLPAWVRTRRAAGWITVATLVIEVIIIDVQAWRGATSHFNVGTLFDGVLFSIMGVAIVAQTFAAVAVAAALWRQQFADRATGWALRLGMTISIIGAMSGGLMTTPTRAQLEDARAGHRMTIAGAHTVGAPDGGPGLPGTGWSREHGDLRVAHFLGLHALQMLPLLSLAVARRGWQEARRVRLTLAASASYVALFGLLMWQALRGQSVLNPDAATLAALAMWVALTAAAMWMASYRSNSVRSHAVVY